MSGPNVGRWFSNRPTLFEVLSLGGMAFHLAKTQLFYRPFLGRVGSHSILIDPHILGNGRSVFIGTRTVVRHGARIEALARYAGTDMRPRLTIGDRVSIEQNVHLVCGREITIGNDVSIMANCAIVDAMHPYERIDEHIVDTPLMTDPVSIGDGSTIGIGTVVLPGTKIGKRVVVGANSVVQGVLPDYTVWAGSPARCVRAFDREAGAWR